MEKTRKLYQDQVYATECDSRILALEEVGEATSVILDQTIFFAEGGGQPCDLGDFVCPQTGAVLASLSHVTENEGIVSHQIAGPLTHKLSVGDMISSRLDWPRRFLNMQRHCGEHILSAAFYELFGGVNRGFHMGEDYMTIDIALEENPDFTEFTDEMIASAELRANKMIWDNLAVSVRHYNTKEETEGIPMRKALAIEEDITLVCVGDENNAAGCVACCGTHPKQTGAVGLIKIYRYDSYKGMTRITFDAGQPAFQRFCEGEEILKTLCRRNSAEASTLLEKISISEQKSKDIRQELYALKKTYLEEHAAEIEAALSSGEKIVLREYSVLKIDDLTGLGRLLTKPLRGLVLLISPTENTLYLQSNGTPDCGKIVRDNAAVWRGKGGGKSDNARAIFPARQELDCFVDYLFKAY
ncbi:MAG: alanyl-tRNA editing protein [Eubacteriales bacterium]|nr:alanyl-tRNA editing protein [Eubacteriales bacterium]